MAAVTVGVSPKAEGVMAAATVKVAVLAVTVPLAFCWPQLGLLMQVAL